jgi:hypothetical protein
MSASILPYLLEDIPRLAIYLSNFGWTAAGVGCVGGKTGFKANLDFCPNKVRM